MTAATRHALEQVNRILADAGWPSRSPLAPPAVVMLDAQLDRLAALPPGWDAPDTPAIDRAILSAVRTWGRRAADALAPLPAAVPLSSGAVQLEWHAGGRVLELEFESADTIHYLRWHPAAGVEDEGTYPADDIARSRELIAWVRGEAITA